MDLRQYPLNQIAEILGRLACFYGLSRECLNRLAGGARQFSLARDEVLFSKGEATRVLHVVVSGLIKKFLPLTGGVDKVVALVEPGASLDVAEVFLGSAHPASAVAKADSYLIAIDRDVLLRQVCQDSGLGCRLLEAASKQVMSLMHDMESCAPRSSLQRVSCFLLQQQPHETMDRFEVVLSGSKRDLAAKLNIAQETLSRVFQQLCAAGAIEVRGRLIRVCDSSKLQLLKMDDCPPLQVNT